MAIPQAGIKYISYLDNTGYGIAGKLLMQALVQAGIPLTWHPLYRPDTQYTPVDTPTIRSGYPELDRCYRKDIPYDLVIIHATPHNYPPFLREEKEKGKIVLGHTVWETDKLPISWVTILNQLDGVIVPSQWNQQVFRASGVSAPVFTLPHLSQFQGREPKHLPEGWLGIPPESFVFYTIGEWNERKLLWKQLVTFTKTFSHEEDVCLVIKTSRLDYTAFKRSWRTLFRNRNQPMGPVIRQLQKQYHHGPRFVMSSAFWSDDEIQYLHTRGDCYLSLSRAEGWGMGAYEAAWYGKPIIMTAFGGQLDFLPAACSYGVTYDLVPVTPMPGWPEYEPDQLWAEPNQAHAATLMREVFLDRSKAQEKGRKLQDTVQNNFSNAAIVNRFCRILSQYTP